MFYRAIAFILFTVSYWNLGQRNCCALDTELEAAAAKLSASTVTVRIAFANVAEPASKEVKPATEVPIAERRPAEQVTVCTGICVGEGLIVTFFTAPSNLEQQPLRTRITLIGGEQVAAQVRVVDRASSLMLLETSQRQLPALKLASHTPKVGAWLLTAAAAGIETPAVSIGTLASQERSLSSIELPPVLQCDLRTTETSSGAGVTNQTAELVGVIAAVEQAGPTAAGIPRSGLSYALGTRHIERLIKARVEGQTIELKRQRPMVGVTFGPGETEGVVRVERVMVDGPAAKVGIQVGDTLLEADEIKIRSAYQAVDLVLRKQPGDTIQLKIERAGKRLEFDLQLAGATGPIVAQSKASENSAVQIGPHVKAVLRDGQLIVQNNDNTALVGVPSNAATQRSPGDEVEMLRRQLLGYERVLKGMQQELETLRQENERLRRSGM